MDNNNYGQLILVMIFVMSASMLMGRKLTKEQMRENTIRINALEITEIEINTIPEKAPDERTIVFDSRALNFDFDKSDVKPRYYEMLELLRDFIETNDYNVVIIGHTDSKGSNAYNMALGMRRAVSVKNKLIELLIKN